MWLFQQPLERGLAERSANHDCPWSQTSGIKCQTTTGRGSIPTVEQSQIMVRHLLIGPLSAYQISTVSELWVNVRSQKQRCGECSCLVSAPILYATPHFES
jgi:hypothetical protein